MLEERKKAELKISGMTCAMCVKTIENALNRLEGIVSVVVNLGAEKAYVTYNPKMTTVGDMKEVVEEAGYQYLGVEGEETEDLEAAARERDLREKRNRFIVWVCSRYPLNDPYVCSSRRTLFYAGCFSSCIYLCKPSDIQCRLPVS